MVHIENVSHILANGLTLATSENANENYVPIGDNSLIDRRSSVTVPNGKNLNEFLPFYFGIGCRCCMLFRAVIMEFLFRTLKISYIV